MPNQALYLKYRPRVFEDMIGQEHITRSLQNALAQDRIRHAYLFSGPRGTGKTTLARIMAKAVNCENTDPHLRPCDQCESCLAISDGRYLDLIEIDAASNNGVDDVRELRDKIGFAPNEGRYKVYVVDEVHRFSMAAFDALLKTLEEPPDHAIFILATTELDKVPATIKSRCLKFEFRRVPVQTVVHRLQQIAELERVAIDPEALELVARQGTGSVRDSISLLDQLIADPGTRLTRTDAEQILGTAGYRAVGDLAQAVIDQDAARGLAILNQALDEGADPRQLGGQIVDHLRNVLLTQIGGTDLVDTSIEQQAALQAQADQVGRGTLLRAIRAFNTALSEMRGGWQPHLPLELALVESTRPLAETVTVAEPRATSAGRQASVTASPTLETQAEEETVPAVSGAIALTDVKQRWPDVIAMLNKADQKPTVALLKTTSIQGIDGDQIILAVEGLALLENLKDPKHGKALQSATKRVFGVALKMKLTPARSAADQPMSDSLAKFVKSVPVESIRPDEGS